MTRQYRPRYSISLKSGATYTSPAQPPDWVRLDDPAMGVFTDFQRVMPRTVEPRVLIDTALEQMKKQGVRLLLVTAEDDTIAGLVTARDIQGEKPIQLIEERRVSRAELTVGEIMTPQSDIPVLNMVSVEEARVGHILATLHELERQHILVVEVDEESGRQCVRGLFSTSQIQKQMHTREAEDIPAAHSLADIVKNVG